MKKNSALLFFVCAKIWLTHAHIYQVHVARILNNSSNSYHYVIGLSDMHSQNFAQNVHDKQTLLQFLSQCPSYQTAAIVEDLSSCNHQGITGCTPFFFDSRGGVLGGITQEILSKNIHTLNIEYRYCRAAGLGPIYQSFFHRKKNLGNNNVPAIPVWMINQEVSKAIDLINQQLKNNVFPQSVHPYAKKMVSSVKQKMNNFPRFWQTKKTVKEISPAITQKRALEELLTFDSPLIDLLIIQSIATVADKKYTVIIAGGSHVQKTFETLSSLGYETLLFQKITSFDNNIVTQLTRTISQ